VGGALAKECHERGVKSAFICPHTPEQDQAEGYLGRVTTMASFAMVYAGAPIFMWIWCIQCAVFINNITATYYSREKVWAIPYELMHGEPYPDSSVVVPFGCAALVLLNKQERKKFKPRCAMLIFIHYAAQHPLYTYALYSPKTKRVLFRQDVIFLTNVFPMREARTKGGLDPDGDSLVVYRSQKGERDANEDDLSFEDWNESDELPLYEDHVNGFALDEPSNEEVLDTCAKDPSWPTYTPNNPAFGAPSCVKIPIPGEVIRTKMKTAVNKPAIENQTPGGDSKAKEDNNHIFNEIASSEEKNELLLPEKPVRRPVKDRWYYEPVVDNDTSVPEHLGALEDIGQHELDNIKNDEHGASSLHGALFLDEELGWCMVNGWGVESGIAIVYYSPVTSSTLVATSDPTAEEHHASLIEVLAWIKDSPIPPQTAKYKSSRILRRTKRGSTKKGMWARVLALHVVLPSITEDWNYESEIWTKST